MSNASVTFSVREGNATARAVNVPIGTRLMPALRAAGFPIDAICGGELSCGTCHVLIDEADYARLSAPREDEQAMLDMLPEGVAGRSRLSCQIVAAAESDGCNIDIPIPV